MFQLCMFSHLHCPRNLLNQADMLFFTATEFTACHKSIYLLSGTFGVIMFIYVGRVAQSA
jgi:hypothetical protein